MNSLDDTFSRERSNVIDGVYKNRSSEICGGRYKVEGKYYNPENEETAKEALDRMKYEEDLRKITRDFEFGLSRLNKEIENMESKIDTETDEKTKNKLILDIQPLYEKKSFAEKYLHEDFFDRKWLLTKVYNNGYFIVKDQAMDLDVMLYELTVTNSEKYKKDLDFYSTLGVVLLVVGILATWIISLGTWINEVCFFLHPIIWLPLSPFVGIGLCSLCNFILYTKYGISKDCKNAEDLIKQGVLTTIGIGVAESVLIKKTGLPKFKDET